MENKFPPLYVQVANKMAAAFKNGDSPFQKPVKENGMPAFIAPINPLTGYGYTPLNALNLAMKGYDDPRWMSAKDGSYNGHLVKKDEKGTLINFPKNSEIQAIRTPDGGKITDENGQTQTKTVEFDKTQNSVAFLFNAAQLNNMPPLEDFLAQQHDAQPLLPLERAAKLLADSGAVIVHGGVEAYYDQKKDEIHLPEKEAFENETRYYQAAIHQLAHWTGHESRLNRPMDGKFGSPEYGREEFRAAMAAMLIGGELKTGHNFGPHAAYTSQWAKMLKDKPFELVRATNDVQKITRLLLGTGQKKEKKQSAAVSPAFEQGDEIAYQGKTFKVLETYKTKNIKVEDETGKRKIVKPDDGLYKSLLDAKSNPQEPEMELSQAEEQTHKIGR